MMYKSARAGPFVNYSLYDLYTRHFAGLQCAGANIYAFRLAIHQDANFLHVDAPGAAIMVVGVRNMIAGTRFLSRNVTFASH